ncbi:MAG: murein L,D-transpeptidase catalytic domain family protein [Alistipes sp.]|nr:murein L,D-transpeptidase catalytic domain family protein [Alistipes sp.]
MLKLFIFLLTLTSPGKAQAAEAPGENLSAERGYEGLAEGFSPLTEASLLFARLGLRDDEVEFEAFALAYAGYRKIEDRNKDILTLIDYSKSSAMERMFVIDMAGEEVLFKSHVAHGRNSGDEYATSFSNVYGSYKRSPGFFITEGTYHGKNGYSLVIDGLEKGINDKAKQRAIVVHGSKYVAPSIAAKRGKVGRSLGCPALPYSVTKDIIDTIKGGSVLFIYPGDVNYIASSPLLAQYDFAEDMLAAATPSIQSYL